MVLEYFTPGTGFLGGSLIGLSAAVLLLLSGEILGASGIISSIVLEPKDHFTKPRHFWKPVFLTTFLLFSNIILGKYYTDDERLGNDSSIPVPSHWAYILGGFFVGFGTRLGNGCTTGHGICGMARLSVRSIAAVGTFMSSALATAALLSPDNKMFSTGTAFLRTDTAPDLFHRWLGFGCSMIFVIPTLYTLLFRNKFEPKGPDSKHCHYYNTTSSSKEENNVGLRESHATMTTLSDSVVLACPIDQKSVGVGGDVDLECTEKEEMEEEKSENTATRPPITAQSSPSKRPINYKHLCSTALSAVLFSLGLALSGMVLPSKVLGFLALYTLSKGTYDPTLLTVMVGGTLVSFLSYQLVRDWRVIVISTFPSLEAPLFSKNNNNNNDKFCIPSTQTLDWKLWMGAFCFGIGWATAGLCPGPATFLLATGAKPVLSFWWPLYFVGAFVAQKIKDHF